MCYCGWVTLKWSRLVQSNYSLHFFINYWVDHENQGLYWFNQINFIHFGEDWGNYKNNDRTWRKFNKPILTWLIYSRILLSLNFKTQLVSHCNDLSKGLFTDTGTFPPVWQHWNVVAALDIINCNWFDWGCDQG